MSAGESFIAHLIELRKRVVHSLLALVAVFLCLMPFANRLYTLLAQPLLAKLPAGGHMIATDVTTPFFVPLKVAGMAALIIALPYILYQAWRFVAPGLYAHEKRLVLPLIVASTLLFLAGVAVAYFLIFPFVFAYIIGTAPEGVAVMTDIDKYLSFALTMFIAFGLAFQVPVVVVVLVRVGMVTTDQLQQVRRYVILGSTVAGAIFMPPDAGSMILFAATLSLLYEVGILAAKLVKPKALDEQSKV
ncbi:MAG TPA: twin-arginine translocase subunit TatC [Gallionellaceae bacterium]